MNAGEEDEEITQEDAWIVVKTHFKENCLVRHQLDSFDEFVEYTMQNIVDKSASIVIRSESQHNAQIIYDIKFGQLYLSKPMVTESDGKAATLFPKAARLRNLTYSAPLYVDVFKRVIRKRHHG